MRSRTNRHAVAMLAMSFAALWFGSGCGDEAPGNNASEKRGSPVNGTPLRVEIEGAGSGATLAVVTDQDERLEVPNVPGETVVGDHLVVVAADGTATLTRTPKAIYSQLTKLPVMYHRSDTQELIQFEGHQGTPAVDPKSGVLCYIAPQCLNPNCSTQGEPFYFPYKSAAGSGAAKCPHCQQYLEQAYSPPEIAEQRQELLAELAKARAARRAGR